MLDLVLAAFVAGLLALGLRRPFILVLAYLYVDIVAPPKITWFLLASIPLSLIVFVAACGGWLIADDKSKLRFTLRQLLLVFLLVYCGITTLGADFPLAAADKWSWVWKALVFAIFLPLTLHSRLRIEATALFMVFSAAAIVISLAIKTLASGGGGYGSIHSLSTHDSGLYESSILSMVAIAIIPLILWCRRHTTVFPPGRLVDMFTVALIFACLLIPIGTQARTGLVCIALLALLSLRSVKRRFLYLAMIGAAATMAIPFLPDSFSKRMSTIENHQSDLSASTRIAVWSWTWDYVKDNPFGGGFDAYRGNKLKIETREAESDGNNTAVDVSSSTDQARAYHSSYFEMLGEQGWPGLLIWLWLQALGLWQMEKIRHRWKDRTGAGEQWQSPLANALQQAQIIYLCGSLFVGIAYQPFILMLIGLQCGLWSYLKRIDAERKAALPRPRPGLPTAMRPALPVGASR